MAKLDKKVEILVERSDSFYKRLEEQTTSKPRLSLNSFDEHGLNEYVYFLQENLQMCNSTIGKQIGYLKWFLRWMMKKGFLNCLDFQTFKPKLKNTQRRLSF